MQDSADIYTFLNHLVPSVSIEKSSVGLKKIIKIMVRTKYTYTKI